jgi:initiation factor 1A
MSRKNIKKNKVSAPREAGVIKDDTTMYGTVTKVLGGSKFAVKLNLQNKIIIGVLRGSLKKGKKHNMVELGSVVLVELAGDFGDKAYIVFVYNRDEVRQLEKKGEYIRESDAETTHHENEIDPDDIGFDFSQL